MPLVAPFGFLAAQGEPLLLDKYSGAEFAFSTRLLSSTYTGDCLKVKRSSDGATQNIGFNSDGYLDQASIETFRGASTEVQIMEWYDQSGNNMVLSQADYGNAPVIYESGAYIQSLGRYAGSFDNKWLISSNYDPSMLNDSSWFIVNTPLTNPGTQDGCMVQAQEFDGTNWRVDVMGFRDGGFFTRLTQDAANNQLNGYDFSTTTGNVVSNIIDTSAVSNVFKFNNSVKTDSNNGRSNTGQGARVTLGRSGNVATGTSAEFLLNEMIYYDSDQTSNEAGILNNINEFYSIY
jgi:hypothetical protein